MLQGVQLRTGGRFLRAAATILRACRSKGLLAPGKNAVCVVPPEVIAVLRITSVTYLLTVALMMFPTKAWALPLHRIGLSFNDKASKKVDVISKTLSAQEAARGIANNARFVAEHTH